MLKLVNKDKCICNSKFVFEYLFTCLLVNWWCTTKLFIYCLFIYIFKTLLKSNFQFIP